MLVLFSHSAHAKRELGRTSSWTFGTKRLASVYGAWFKSNTEHRSVFICLEKYESLCYNTKRILVFFLNYKGIYNMIGKTVTVTIDRPRGAYHPKYPNLYYPINYGYIKNTMSPDGEEMDAYVLGIDQPLREFTGHVIAIIRRLNDVEDKLVVAPEGLVFSKAQIIELTAFQEQYFDIEVEL